MEDQREPISPERIQRYAVYSIQNTMDDGKVFTRSFIVIKNGYGVIVRFTRLQEYAGIYSRGTYKPITANPEEKLYFICSMLNYILVDHGAEYGIRHVFDITKEMLAEYFDAYAMEKKKDGSYRSQKSVEYCITYVTEFMSRLAWKFGGYMKVSKEDLYVEKSRMTSKGTLIKKNVPAFQATGVAEREGIFREIPTKAMEVLIPLAFRYTRDIAFGICLQAFAGLRAGEVCNVRQESSPFGAGIRFTEVSGKVRKAEIDLRQELLLRSDGIKTGSIKKERLQCVYPAFLGVFMKAYELHKEYLQTLNFEEQYAPMFVNRNGKAMTYENYRERFRELIDKYLRPVLVKSDDPELRIYGQLLYENSLGTHAMRHWYTVQLVLRGEDIANIQYWRGDSSPESAFTYLQNKGDLNRELKETNDRLMTILMEIGGENIDD